MTEYQPYGARHFLREADPEAASELRRRRVALADGELVAKGDAVDTDALDAGDLFVYRTLVLRRSPAQSRPPAAYRLTWRGEYYDVWQRDAAAVPGVDRLALGTAAQPVARPRCARVEALAARAAPGTELVAASRPPVIATSLAGARYPRSWSTPATRATPTPEGAGAIEARVAVQRATTTRSGSPARPGRRSSSRSTASRPARSATSSTTAASTCAWAKPSCRRGAPDHDPVLRRRPAPGQRWRRRGGRPAGALGGRGRRRRAGPGRPRRRAGALRPRLGLDRARRRRWLSPPVARRSPPRSAWCSPTRRSSCSRCPRSTASSTSRSPPSSGS